MLKKYIVKIFSVILGIIFLIVSSFSTSSLVGKECQNKIQEANEKRINGKSKGEFTSSLNEEQGKKEIVKKTEAKKLLNTYFEISDVPEELLQYAEIDITKVKKLDNVDSLDMHSITTIKKDNTRELHIFNSPIKFYDKKSKEIKFIDNSFKKSRKTYRDNITYAYENTANNIKVFIPWKASDGVLIKDNTGNSLSFKPITSKTTKAKIKKSIFLEEEEEVAEYKSIFGDGLDLQYIPQNDGVKENILIAKNYGKYTFDFSLQADGLVPNTKQGKKIDFVNENTENVVFSLGELFIRDSYIGKFGNNEHISFDNYYKIEDLGEYNYKLTYVLDRDFLNKKSTVYPVLVDPSISPIREVNDAPVYSSRKTENFSGNAWIQLGKVGGSYGVGHGYFQTKMMEDYKYINPNNIKMASLHVYEGSGTTYASKIIAYNTDKKWKSSNITWKNKSAKKGSALDSIKIEKSGFYDFDITSAVKQWLKNELGEGGWSYAHGVMLVPSTSSQGRKDICSVNYGTVSKRPSIKIEYTEDTSIEDDIYFITNYNSGLNLDANHISGNVRQYNITNADTQQWVVKKRANGYYTLANRFFGMKGYLDVESLSGNPQNANIWKDGTGSSIRFKIIKNNDGTGTYRIMAKELNDLEALYTTESSKKSGANVAFSNYLGTPKSQWKFSVVDEKYKIPDLKVKYIDIPSVVNNLSFNTFRVEIYNYYTSIDEVSIKYEFIDANNNILKSGDIKTAQIRGSSSISVPINWQFSSLGNYKIRIIVNSDNKVQEYSENNNTLVKEFIIQKGYAVRVNNYYDRAFNVRYNAAGDRKTQINNVYAFVNTIFKENFGIIITNNIPIMITSTADECKIKRGVGVNSNTINQKCPGGQDHTPACTDSKRSYLDFIKQYPGHNRSVSVFWTGNKLWDEHGKANNRSFQWFSYGINIQELFENSSEFYDEITPCLAHELAHIFGAPDHYHEILSDGSCVGGKMCKVCNPITGREESCLMNNGWMSDIKSRDNTKVFCKGCIEDMRNYIASYY